MERIRYRIEFIHEALLQFKELPKSTQQIVGKAIKERLELDPIKFGKPLRYSLKGYRRLRISTYRVVYRIDAIAKLVTIDCG